MNKITHYMSNATAGTAQAKQTTPALQAGRPTSSDVEQQQSRKIEEL